MYNTAGKYTKYGLIVIIGSMKLLLVLRVIVDQSQATKTTPTDVFAKPEM